MRKVTSIIFFLLILLFLSACEDYSSIDNEQTNDVTNETSPNDNEQTNDVTNETSPNDNITTKKYTVMWKDFYGNTLETDFNVEEGTIPIYNGNTPYLPSTDMYSFTFAGWTPKVGPVYANTTYSAQFTPKSRQEVVVITNSNFLDFFTFDLTTSSTSSSTSAIYTIFLSISPKSKVISWTSVTIRIPAIIPYTYGPGGSSSWQQQLDFHKTYTPSVLSNYQSIVISASNVKFDTNSFFNMWKTNINMWTILGSATVII